MFTRTTVAIPLLDRMLECDLIAVSQLVGDEWRPVTDRRLLYEVAIEALITEANATGFRVCPGIDPCESSAMSCVSVIEIEDEDDQDDQIDEALNGRR